MRLGRYGIWNSELGGGDASTPGERAEAAQELESLGFRALWLGGSRDVSDAAPLIEATSSLVVATGILSIWQHDAAGVAARHTALSAAHPGRFILGIGASHALLASDYHRPYSSMVDYLDALDAAPTPVPATERVLAALGPKMLRLARDRSAGAHPYLVNPEHTRQARAILGPDALLAPEMKVVLETTADRARPLARAYLSRYLEMPNYTNNFVRLGFSEDDFRDGGSDRLIDTVFAWGDDATIRRRVEEFHDAGADHVALQVVPGPDSAGLPRAGWRRLAELLPQ
ncbi:LLM class F420-dependent oxidoreductase [Streptomyces sp. SL13]|uniref:LLM class F420-dependent oxidoreductase n=1 Tax=Streptantibioticus silvisoli TaxID=2705255 RepID=A0AA90KA07_9ACTN|nr:LLM class F420-dependent oxidoreductase [Streptantibioticus silvisoli]MDI5971487.1 LLM class F420-dependent oxidoreductase [Streptantibioticus silvisoli]